MKVTAALVIGVVVMAFVTAPESSAAQYGFAANGGSDQTLGVQSQITQPGHYIGESMPRVNQVSTTLGDGTFLQIGWVDSSNFCASSFTYFSSIFLSDGSHLGNEYNTGSCGLTGTHFFGVVVEPDPNHPYQYYWHTRIDGNDTGPDFETNINTTQSGNDGIFTEIVKTGSAPPASTDLAQAEYNPTNVRHLDNNWANITSAHTVRDQIYCPPFYLHVITNDDVSIGKSSDAQSCPQNGDDLW